MPIQIEQKYPRCQLCGRLIPLRNPVRELPNPAGGKPLRFCSELCLADYQKRLAASAAG